MEYKQSEVAAAVVIFAAGEIQAVDTQKAISALIQHVEKVTRNVKISAFFPLLTNDFRLITFFT